MRRQTCILTRVRRRINGVRRAAPRPTHGGGRALPPHAPPEHTERALLRVRIARGVRGVERPERDQDRETLGVKADDAPGHACPSWVGRRTGRPAEREIPGPDEGRRAVRETEVESDGARPDDPGFDLVAERVSG